MEGRRLFSDALYNDDHILDFNRRLTAALWDNRNANQSLHRWLDQLNLQVIDAFGSRCVTLRDELETLGAFASRVAPGGDRADMVLGELAGEGEHLNRLTLSTLHSAKGREFGLVFMFGMDNGRLPRSDASQGQLAEARRLFYVGFTRAKAEVHLLHTSRRSSPFVDEIRQHLADDDI